MEIPAAITVDNVDAKTSAVLSIGANAATTTLNLGTNGGTQAINMCTGSGVKTITIGGGNDDAVTINGNLTVSGTTISFNSSNAVIMDKVITLNKGGADASGGLVGLEVEEAGTSNAGYLRTNAARDAWVAKAPNGNEFELGATTYTASAPLSLSGTNLSITLPQYIATTTNFFTATSEVFIPFPFTLNSSHQYIKIQGRVFPTLTSIAEHSLAFKARGENNVDVSPSEPAWVAFRSSLFAAGTQPVIAYRNDNQSAIAFDMTISLFGSTNVSTKNHYFCDTFYTYSSIGPCSLKSHGQFSSSIGLNGLYLKMIPNDTVYTTASPGTMTGSYIISML